MFLQKCFFERSFAYFRSALHLHWVHRHFPSPLETDWQVGISWHSSCPVHCFPSWQRPIVAGPRLRYPECTAPGQGVPGPRAPAAQAGATPGLRLDEGKTCPFAPRGKSLLSAAAGPGEAGRERDRLHGTGALLLQSSRDGIWTG